MLVKFLKSTVLKIVPEIMVFSFLAGISIPFLSYYVDKNFNGLTLVASLFYIVLGVLLYRKIYKNKKHWANVKDQIVTTEQQIDDTARKHGEILANTIINWSAKKILIVFSLSLLLLFAFPIIVLITFL